VKLDWIESMISAEDVGLVAISYELLFGFTVEFEFFNSYEFKLLRLLVAV
jgi:hypothetical protein